MRGTCMVEVAGVVFFFFFQAEDGIRDLTVTGVQTCALPICMADDPAKIPMKWDEYWNYWKKAQDALRKKDPAKYGKLYGIGMTESTREIGRASCRERV